MYTVAVHLSAERVNPKILLFGQKLAKSNFFRFYVFCSVQKSITNSRSKVKCHVFKCGANNLYYSHRDAIRIQTNKQSQLQTQWNCCKSVGNGITAFIYFTWCQLRRHYPLLYHIEKTCSLTR